MSFIQVELDAYDRAEGVAGLLGVPTREVMGGLALLWRWCWKEKTDICGEAHLRGFFGGEGRSVVEALEAFRFIERTGDGCRVRGAERYLRISKARAEAGRSRAASAKRDERGRLRPAIAGEVLDAPPAKHQRPTSSTSEQRTSDPAISEPPPPTSSSEPATSDGLVVVEKFWTKRMDAIGTTPMDVELERVASWQPTVDGLWEMLQTKRELLGLKREGRRPGGFEDWALRALTDPGPEGIAEAVDGFLGDPSIKTPNWPTAVLTSEGVWAARRPGKLRLLQTSAEVRP